MRPGRLEQEDKGYLDWYFCVECSLRGWTHAANLIV
jgi:hypothetical protein